MHTINIHNLTNKEQLTHSFALISGSIKNSNNNTCSTTCDKITLVNKTVNSLLDCVLKNDCFKFVVELQSGLNEFVLTFCCVSSVFALEYTEKDTDFVVTPLYIISDGHDGKFQAPNSENNSIESACKRITTGVKLLQCLIAEKLHEQNLGRHTFKLAQNCRVFHSKLHCNTARKLQQGALWDYLAREIINSGLNSERSKFLGLLSCTRFQTDFRSGIMLHEEVLKQTEAYVALGAGGLALFGTGCLYTWPEGVVEVVARFLDGSPVDSKNFMDDSSYRGTLGACFSTTLGAVLHELCHTFDLGHTKHGIMGRGFQNVSKVFTLDCVDKKINSEETYFTKSSAVLLRYHKWISGLFDQRTYVLSFDSTTRVVKSTAGIKVIEIRSESDQLVQDSWVFVSKVLKFSFRIPEEVLERLQGEKCVVVVEDAKGNIVKDRLLM